MDKEEINTLIEEIESLKRSSLLVVVEGIKDERALESGVCT